MKRYLLSCLAIVLLLSSGSAAAKDKKVKRIGQANPIKTKKMKVEIWSDIMCPFCYIGKRKFEAALQQFDSAGQVEVEWRSFQLDPSIRGGQQQDLYHYLAERKGISYEQAKQLHDNVVAMAAEVGLHYRFDKAVVANSYDAHRLIQLAKRQQLGDAAEERLFKAYFEDGLDFGDHQVLLQLGKEIGLTEAQLTAMLNSREGADAVDADIEVARQIGVTGVPFFVFDRKYAVSGAQPSEVFLNTLNRSFTEWQQSKTPQPLDITEGPACTPGGDCE